jgi:hypothetical protein
MLAVVLRSGLRLGRDGDASPRAPRPARPIAPRWAPGTGSAREVRTGRDLGVRSDRGPRDSDAGPLSLGRRARAGEARRAGRPGRGSARGPCTAKTRTWTTIWAHASRNSSPRSLGRRPRAGGARRVQGGAGRVQAVVAVAAAGQRRDRLAAAGPALGWRAVRAPLSSVLVKKRVKRRPEPRRPDERPGAAGVLQVPPRGQRMRAVQAAGVQGS